jgi:SAM-dependent methyltransferase
MKTKKIIREGLFRLWYWYVSKADRNAEVLFMNYGYNDSHQPQDAAANDCYCTGLYHHLLSQAEIRDKDIVEIGCGRGGGLAYVSSAFGPCTATGVDIEKGAIDFCRRHYRIEGLTFMQGDARRLSLDSGSCDIVLNVESSHRYGDMPAFLSEVNRILRPGGTFLLTDFRNAGEVGDLKRQLLESGLEVIKARNITREVVAALDADDERKRRLIKKLVPSILRKTALRFAAVRGTETYEKFLTRRFVYLSYILRKPMPEMSVASRAPGVSAWQMVSG